MTNIINNSHYILRFHFIFILDCTHRNKILSIIAFNRTYIYFNQLTSLLEFIILIYFSFSAIQNLSHYLKSKLNELFNFLNILNLNISYKH